MARFNSELVIPITQQILQENLKNTRYLFDTFQDWSFLINDVDVGAIQLPTLDPHAINTLASKRTAYASGWDGLTGSSGANQLDLDIVASGLFTVDNYANSNTVVDMITAQLEVQIPRMLAWVDKNITNALVDTLVTQNGLTASANNTVLASGSTLQFEDIMTAKAYIMDNGAEDHNLTLAVNAMHYADLFSIDQFIDISKNPNATAMANGVVGTVAGIEVVLSGNLQKLNATGFRASTQNKYVSYLYSKSAMGVAKHKGIEIEIAYDTAYKMWIVHPTIKLGRKVTNVKHAYAKRDN